MNFSFRSMVAGAVLCVCAAAFAQTSANDFTADEFLEAVITQDSRLDDTFLDDTAAAGYVFMLVRGNLAPVAQALAQMDWGTLSRKQAVDAIELALPAPNRDRLQALYLVALHETVNSAIRNAKPFDAAKTDVQFRAAMEGELFNFLDGDAAARRGADVLAPLEPAQFFQLMGMWLVDVTRAELFATSAPLRELYVQKAEALAKQEFDRLGGNEKGVVPAGTSVLFDLGYHLTDVWPAATGILFPVTLR